MFRKLNRSYSRCFFAYISKTGVRFKIGKKVSFRNYIERQIFPVLRFWFSEERFLNSVFDYVGSGAEIRSWVIVNCSKK